ncbi:MAG: tetratricopeptide repeat protein [Sulfuricurvum sp.]|nr:tetratricopeptide repeat protein [Sulfuricurvum sp.]
MTLFQFFMFAATLFFAYQIFRHVQTLEDNAPQEASSESSDAVVVSASVLVDQADSAYEHGELDHAKNILEEAFRLEPHNAEIVNKLAFVTAKTGERLRAIELYERSLELEENDDLTHNAIASLYRSENAYERAEDHYRKALEIDDAYAQTYYNYANLLVDMGEIEEARAMYKHALELQSDFQQAREALLSLGSKQ